MDLADIVVVFEGPYNDFTSSFLAPSYRSQYKPSKFASIVYSVSTAAAVDSAVSMSKQRSIGHIYLAGSDYSSLSPLIYQQAGMRVAIGFSRGCVLTISMS
jgi:hypothetical protein